jgi:hypothetical protein
MAAIGLAYQERCLSSAQEREDWKRYEVKGIRDKVVPREDLPICDEIARMMPSKSELLMQKECSPIAQSRWKTERRK